MLPRNRSCVKICSTGLITHSIQFTLKPSINIYTYLFDLSSHISSCLHLLNFLCFDWIRTVPIDNEKSCWGLSTNYLDDDLHMRSEWFASAYHRSKRLFVEVYCGTFWFQMLNYFQLPLTKPLSDPCVRTTFQWKGKQGILSKIKMLGVEV